MLHKLRQKSKTGESKGKRYPTIYVSCEPKNECELLYEVRSTVSYSFHLLPASSLDPNPSSHYLSTTMLLLSQTILLNFLFTFRF